MSTPIRSEEHTSELQSPVVISYAVFCLKKKKKNKYNKSKMHVTKNKIKSYVILILFTFPSHSFSSLPLFLISLLFFFFFNDTATTEIYTTTDTLSLHDALPICEMILAETVESRRAALAKL